MQDKGNHQNRDSADMMNCHFKYLIFVSSFFSGRGMREYEAKRACNEGTKECEGFLDTL